MMLEDGMLNERGIVVGYLDDKTIQVITKGKGTEIGNMISALIKSVFEMLCDSNAGDVQEEMFEMFLRNAFETGIIWGKKSIKEKGASKPEREAE